MGRKGGRGGRKCARDSGCFSFLFVKSRARQAQSTRGDEGGEGERALSTRANARAKPPPNTRTTHAPIVGDNSSNVSLLNLSSSELFPTPESPTSRSLMRWSKDCWCPPSSPMTALCRGVAAWFGWSLAQKKNALAFWHLFGKSRQLFFCFSASCPVPLDLSYYGSYPATFNVLNDDFDS